MVWISFIILLSSMLAWGTPEKLLTKHAVESIRYISMDGKVAYVKKRPGVLALVSYFRSVDFISEASTSEFLVTATAAKERVAIEVIPDTHTQPNFFKKHKILVAKFGDTQTKEMGLGQAAKLHLGDEWLSFYNVYERALTVINVITQKKYEIRLSSKPNPFFIPQVEMINAETVVYTDINETGVAAVIGYNLATQKTLVIYKATQTATQMELCRGENYLALGEFPYEGVSRGSQILQVKLGGSTNLTGHSTLYESLDHDMGNMICLSDSLYFIKTMNQDKKLGIKTTEAVKLTLKDTKLKVKTSLNHVTQLINVDGRVMAPVRGDFYVLEGEANLGTDTLKSGANKEGQ